VGQRLSDFVVCGLRKIFVPFADAAKIFWDQHCRHVISGVAHRIISLSGVACAAVYRSVDLPNRCPLLTTITQGFLAAFSRQLAQQNILPPLSMP
jgi:hypothetical protein